MAVATELGRHLSYPQELLPRPPSAASPIGLPQRGDPIPLRKRQSGPVRDWPPTVHTVMLPGGTQHAQLTDPAALPPPLGIAPNPHHSPPAPPSGRGGFSGVKRRPGPALPSCQRATRPSVTCTTTCWHPAVARHVPTGQAGLIRPGHGAPGPVAWRHGEQSRRQSSRALAIRPAVSAGAGEQCRGQCGTTKPLVCQTAEMLQCLGDRRDGHEGILSTGNLIFLILPSQFPLICRLPSWIGCLDNPQTPPPTPKGKEQRGQMKNFVISTIVPKCEVRLKFPTQSHVRQKKKSGFFGALSTFHYFLLKPKAVPTGYSEKKKPCVQRDKAQNNSLNRSLNPVIMQTENPNVP